MSEVKRDLPRGRTASPRTPINAEDLVACGVWRLCGHGRARLRPARLPAGALTM